MILCYRSLILFVVFYFVISGCSQAPSPNAPLQYTYISGPGFKNEKVFYQVKDGLAFYQGDMVLGTVEEVTAIRKEFEHEAKIKGAVGFSRARGLKYTWPGGVIPYTIDSAVPRANDLKKAMEHIQAKTTVRFVPRTNEKEYVRIKGTTKRSCYSYFGRTIGKPTDTVLGPNCYFGTIVHELMHAMGFYHEHQRSDRDKYVNIHWNNIRKGFESQFNKFSATPGTKENLTSYDLGSIMHYPNWAFSKDTKNASTITPKGSGRVSIGQRKELSKLDIEGVNALYPPPQPEPIEEPRTGEIKLEKAKFTTLEKIHAKVSGITNPKDWVAVAHQSSPNEDYIQEFFATETDFDFGPFSPGKYEVRLYANESYDIIASTTFEVTGAYLVDAVKDNYRPNEIIKIRAEGFSGRTNWIAIGTAGSPNNRNMAWIYVNGTKKPGEPDLATQVSFSNLPIGDYEVRGHLGRGYHIVAMDTFSVEDSVVVSTSEQTIHRDDSIEVKFAGFSNASDWIGLFKKGAANNKYLRWLYIGGSTTPKSNPSSGKLVFKKLPPGDYEVRGFTKNTFTRIAKDKFKVE